MIFDRIASRSCQFVAPSVKHHFKVSRSDNYGKRVPVLAGVWQLAAPKTPELRPLEAACCEEPFVVLRNKKTP